jgi:hypothetical protein
LPHPYVAGNHENKQQKHRFSGNRPAVTNLAICTKNALLSQLKHQKSAADPYYGIV